LTLSSSGKISGTPASAGTSYFSVQARDAAASPQAATQSELIAASVGGANVTPPPQASGYTLMFSDDFNSLNLSPNGVGSFNWYDPGMFWESPAPYSNISTSNSALSLLWKNGQGTSDTSLATAAKDGSSYRAWRYGYFEARMRWDTVTGAWPAIWLIPVQGITCGGCEQGELDIFEGQGVSPNVFTGTIHDWNSPTGAHSAGKNYNLGSVDLSQYHTYGVLWTPGQVTWYFDNQALYSFPTYSIFDQQKYYLIIGSQEGANWSYGNLSNVTASQIGVNVDWVRVWQP
jgi:beta-glucanase (GH16 family)